MSDDASPSFDFAEPTRLTVGTEGLPGRRMFFLQAREGPVLATLKMEKIQVAALGSWIAKTLEDLPRPGHLPDDRDLEPETFLQPAWSVGSLGGSYDPETDRILLVAAEMPSGDDEEDDDPSDEEASLLGTGGATARIRATREQMAALAIRATRLVESGRPPCPLCGYPLDPIGHQCPRTNGFRPPNL
ncbi:MAG: DUF3090 domain-containing protein [Acidimicrobiales bacterium]